MVEFLAWLQQNDDGCDYSIACGERVERITASSRDEAVEKLKRLIIGEWSNEILDFEDGYRPGVIKLVALYQVGYEEIALISEWYEEAAERKEEARKDADRVKKRKEYERLKKEFADG